MTGRRSTRKVMAADILVLLTPIWLGEKSSVCTRVIERLYGNSHLLNENGQWSYYGRVGGCIVTGNEDGVKHCAMNILYSLQHLGYVIPPQADSGWIGEAGPGPSYLDPGSGGPENDFTARNTTFMTWNLLHVARMLKDARGIPAHGNQPASWACGAASTTKPRASGLSIPSHAGLMRLDLRTRSAIIPTMRSARCVVLDGFGQAVTIRRSRRSGPRARCAGGCRRVRRCLRHRCASPGGATADPGAAGARPRGGGTNRCAGRRPLTATRWSAPGGGGPHRLGLEHRLR